MSYQIGDKVEWKPNQAKTCRGIVRTDNGSNTVEVKLMEINCMPASLIIDVKREILNLM